MTSEEFWKNDPELFNVFRTSFISKQKRQAEYDNYKCWLNGLYIHDGETVLNERLIISISKMLGDKKSSTSDRTYPVEPYNFDKEKKEKKKEVLKEKQNRDYHNSLLYFGRAKQRYLEELQKKKGE